MRRRALLLATAVAGSDALVVEPDLADGTGPPPDPDGASDGPPA